MTTTANGNERIFGYQIIDPDVQHTSKETWDAIYDVFRKYDFGFLVSNKGVFTVNTKLTLEEAMNIREKVAEILPQAHGELYGNGFHIDITPDTTYEEIESAIWDLDIPDIPILPF